MKYSILIPVYNVEKYLKACVLSALGQTYQDYEILLYDDASTDRSGELCDYYAAQYPDKVRAFHGRENIGLLRGRLELMKRASGERFIFLDSDDFVHQQLLERVNEVFEEKDCDAVIYGYEGCYELRFGIEKHKSFGMEEGIKEFIHENKQELYQLILSGTINAIWRKAFKRELFDLTGDYQEFYDVTIGEDLFFTLQILSEAEKTVLIPDRLYYYRINLNSMTHLFDEKGFQSMIKVIKKLKQYAAVWKEPQGMESVYQMALDVCERFLMSMAKSSCPYNKQERRARYDMIINNALFKEAYKEADIRQGLLGALMEGAYEQVEWQIRKAKLKWMLKEAICRLICK